MRKLSLIVCTTLAASACVYADDITLTYLTFDPAAFEPQKAAIAGFEALNPGVKVEALVLPVPDYWPRLAGMAAAKDLPDVLGMSSGYIQYWAEVGNLADLTSLASDLDLSAYYESAVNVGRINDGLYAFPTNWVTPVLYYNKDAFDAAGLSYPNDDWTWDQFREAAKALTVDQNGDGSIDQWGYYAYGRYEHLDGWIYRNGGRLLNADETALDLNEPAVNALRFLTDLVLVDKVAPAPKDLEGVRQQDVFPMGMSAMWVGGSWRMGNNRTIAGDSFKWGIAQIPAGPDATPETGRTYAWSDMLAIGANSEKKELAWEFIQYMTGGNRKASDFLGGTIPALRAIAEDEAWLERDQQPDNKELLLAMGKLETYTGFTRGWEAWRGYAASSSGGMNGELDEVFNGRKSLDDAIKAFTAYANDVLSN